MYSQILVLHSSRYCQDTLFGFVYISLQKNEGNTGRNAEIKRIKNKQTIFIRVSFYNPK